MFKYCIAIFAFLRVYSLFWKILVNLDFSSCSPLVFILQHTIYYALNFCQHLLSF
jgi:hypothetical protein